MPQTTTEHAKLLVKLHGHGSRTIELVTDSFTIGRKSENDLAIDDHTISSRHARIVKVQSVYFVEDLKSTNGTAVNEKPIERHQLRDADVISIGKHRLIFQDSGPGVVTSSAASMDTDQTMVLPGGSRPSTQSAADARILVTSGNTDQTQYVLTKQVALIGAQDDATIRLTGWFAPKAVARISRRGPQYSISPVQGAKKLLVNGKDVTSQQELKNGDQIQVAGVTLSFYLTTPKKT